MNERTLKVLEWTTVLEHLSKHATSEIGKRRCFDVEININPSIIKQEQGYTTQAKYLIDHMLYPPMGTIINVYQPVSLSKLASALKNTELTDIAKTIQTSRLLKSFFSREQEKAQALYELSKGLFENRELEDNILDTFDEAGNMLDSASPELKNLRNSLKDRIANLKNKLNNLVSSSGISKYLQESVYTQRDGRYVVPVKIEFKAHVQGIVHDVSSSGATLFIEPKAVVELNNAVRETELKIDAEVRRILSELTSKVGEYADDILAGLEILAEIDFIFAKAKYSISIKGIEPELNTGKFLSFKKMRHPILLTVINNVVPNDLEIGKKANMLIITGSNTGGKTVTLKTAGLCVLMAKAGLHIPAVEASIYPFENVFADIGDEQSVIQSLSTFSGHMINIINILNNTNDKSLIILDEVGAGTDPSEGSALAQAVLESLHKKSAITLVSTHYGELKSLAYLKEGFQNASVEFDTETLEPTYRLLIDIPGKSNAITIAKNLGLSEEIAQKAQEIYLTQKDPTGAVLEGLQDTQQKLSKNAQAVESAKEELEKLEKEYGERLEKIKTEKKKTLNVYKKKFESDIEKARAEIRDILEEIRITRSEKIARRSFNRIAEVESDFRKTAAGDEEEFEHKYDPVDWGTVKTGDTVLVKDLKQNAVILFLPDKNNNVQIQIGMLKTTVKSDKLAKAKGEAQHGQKLNSKERTNYRFSRTEMNNTLDLRGLRVEDALEKVEYYLDQVSLANLSPVYIIHGHGTGALREAVREYLNDSPYVSKYRSGEPSEGGDGVSVAELA
jgi:DNA mismatch repair protein MutS2